MIDEIMEDTRHKMDKSIGSLQLDLQKIRTGRAHPSLLDHVKVKYYDNDTPISQVANVNVEDARTLSITPWEKQMVAAIEKAIMTSDLGLNPVTSGTVIRIPLPPLTEARRKDLIKIVRQNAETAKVAIRNIRRNAKSDFKELVNEKEIGEDEERRATDKVQKLTDKHVLTIDKMVAEKEKELMTI